MGDGDDNTFRLSASGLPESLEVFERHDRGYRFQFTDQLDLNLCVNEAEYDLRTLIEDRRATAVDEVNTAQGVAQVYEINLHCGDWGLVDLGNTQVFFQVLETSQTVAGRKAREMLDGPLAVALLMALVLHFVFLTVAFLQSGDADLESLRVEERIAEFNVDEIEDIVEEDEDEAGEREDADGDAPGEGEGEVGDVEEEVEDTEVDDEIDIEEVGVHGALTDDTLGTGDSALDELFADDGAMDELSIAMDGDAGESGRGTGGLGPRTDGDGGGTDGAARLTGIGDGPPGINGRPSHPVQDGEESIRRPDPTETEDVTVGDFCDPGEIQRVVRARSNAIQHCFERQLQTEPSLGGDVMVNWRIELDGSVSQAMIAETTLDNRDVEGCIVRQIERMSFEQPDGGMCEVNYPFVFTGVE